MWASGAALVWSALLRVFPAFIVLGLALKILQQSWHARRLHLTRAQWQFAGGAVIALAVLFPISLTVGGENHGLSVWKAFATNSRKHLATPVTNNIGLPTVVSFEPATRASRVGDYWVSSPWDAWKDARRRVFGERRVLYWALVAAYVVLLALAVRREDDWVALVLGVGAIPILSDMASYYFSVLLAFALLWRRLPVAGIGLALHRLPHRDHAGRSRVRRRALHGDQRRVSPVHRRRDGGDGVRRALRARGRTHDRHSIRRATRHSFADPVAATILIRNFGTSSLQQELGVVRSQQNFGNVMSEAEISR